MEGEETQQPKLLSLKEEKGIFEEHQLHFDEMIKLNDSYMWKYAQIHGILLFIIIAVIVSSSFNPLIEIGSFSVLTILLGISAYLFYRNTQEVLQIERETDLIMISQDEIEKKSRTRVMKYLLIRVLAILTAFVFLKILGIFWWAPFILVSIFFFAYFRMRLFLDELYFFKIEEFPDSEIKDRIYNVCNQTIEKSNIYLLDHSKTKFANAAVFLKGKKQRTLYVSNNLLNNFRDDEIDLVILHELGHIEMKHLNKQGVFSIVATVMNLALITFFCYYLFDFSINYPPNSVLGLILIYVLYFFTARIVHSLKLHLTRNHELKADEWAYERLTNFAVFESLMVRLYLTNGFPMKDSPKDRLLYLTHPNVFERIANIRKTKAFQIAEALNQNNSRIIKYK